MTELTADAMQRFIPAGAPFLPGMNEAAMKFGLNSKLRWAHFLAQTAHESGEYRTVVENLNYSQQALRSLFGKYFQDDATAAAYARQPEKIAARAYASRYGNGAEATGDGWKYRGRGLIQVTFHDNYRACSIALFGDTRLLDRPQLLTEPQYAALSGGWYFSSHGCLARADDDNVEAVTKLVNGGVNGLTARTELLKRAKTALGI